MLLLLNFYYKAKLWSSCFTKTNNPKSIKKRDDWTIGRERSTCLSRARQRPPAASLQLSVQHWLQRMSSADSVIMSAYRRRQHPNTVRQNRRAAVIIVCNVMNEEETWLISEVCTMSFKVNLLFKIRFTGQNVGQRTVTPSFCEKSALFIRLV